MVFAIAIKSSMKKEKLENQCVFVSQNAKEKWKRLNHLRKEKLIIIFWEMILWNSNCNRGFRQQFVIYPQIVFVDCLIWTRSLKNSEYILFRLVFHEWILFHLSTLVSQMLNVSHPKLNVARYMRESQFLTHFTVISCNQLIFVGFHSRKLGCWWRTSA